MNESEADLAINRVLAAEQAATEQLEGCRADGVRRVEEARERARQIASRAERRIARLHALADGAIAAELEKDRALARELATAHPWGSAESEVMQQAVERLIGRWFSDPEEGG